MIEVEGLTFVRDKYVYKPYMYLFIVDWELVIAFFSCVGFRTPKWFYWGMFSVLRLFIFYIKSFVLKLFIYTMYLFRFIIKYARQRTSVFVSFVDEKVGKVLTESNTNFLLHIDFNQDNVPNQLCTLQ